MLLALGLLLVAIADTGAGGARRGRPSKLTAELQNRIVALVRDGVALEVAAVAVGVHRSTLFEWLQRGRAASVLYEHGEVVPESEAIFVRFADAVERARAEAEVTAVRVIRQAMDDDIRAAQWYLERSHPERWARHRGDPPVAPPADSRTTMTAGNVAAHLASLDPSERARIVWDAIVAASSDVDVAQELAVGHQLHDDAQRRLALNAPDEQHVADPTDFAEGSAAEGAEGLDT